MFVHCHPVLSVSLCTLCNPPSLLAEERAAVEAAKVAGTSESNDIPLKCYLNAKTHTQQEQMRAQEDNGLQNHPAFLKWCVTVHGPWVFLQLSYLPQGLDLIKTNKLCKHFFLFFFFLVL